MYSSYRWISSILLFLLTTLIVACQPTAFESASQAGSVPNEIQVLTTLNQVSYTGSEHPLIKILVVDELSRPVPNTNITLTTNSGTATLLHSQTDNKGEAYIRWNFGMYTGQFQLIMAAEKDLYSFSRTVNMYVIPTNVVTGFSSITGTSSIPADGYSPSTITITLKDANNNPVVGMIPTFSATDSGNDNIYGACSTSNASGVSLCSLSSSTAETKQLKLLSPVVVNGNSVVFDSNIILSSLRFSSQPIALNTDSNFTTQPVVTAYYQDGSVASNSTASVTLTAFSGTNCTGTLSSTTMSGNLTQTLLGGIATFSGLRPLKTSIRSLKATLGSLTVCSQYFNVNPGAPANIAISGGNSQTDVVHTALSPFSVIVTDANQNIIPYTNVAWSVLSGGGSLSTATSATNTLGVAANTLTLGDTVGVNTVKASILAGSTSVIFTANGTSSTPASIAVSSGDGQSAPAGTATASTLQTIVRDIYLNPVAGASVSWSVASGGGSLSTYTSTTDVNGIAATQLTVGQTVGANQVIASLSGTTSSATFNATTTAGAASTISITSGDNQVGTAGSPLPVVFSVKVSDDWGNPVSGVTVNWTNSIGLGTLGAATSSTDASGIATNTYILGNAAGANSVTARISLLPTGETTFGATGVAGIASQISKIAGDTQSANLGSSLSTALKVQVLDSLNNQISGETIDWITSSGTLASASTITDASGYSTNTLTVGITAGAQTITSTINGTAISTIFNYTATIASPVGLSGSVSGSTASLNWTPVTGATSYKIYSSSSSGSGYTLLGTSATESYTSTISATTYFVVSAVNSSIESAYSNELSLTPDANSWLNQIGLLTARTYMGNKLNAEGDETCSAIDIDTSNNIICAGSTTGHLGEINGGSLDPVIVKFNNSGAIQWITQLGATTKGAVGDNSDSASFTNIKYGADGYIYAVGVTDGSIQETNGGLQDVFVVKLEPAHGSIIWIKQLGAISTYGSGNNAGHEDVHGLEVSSDGHIYIAGRTNGAVAENNGGGDDAFIVKLAIGGEVVWIKQFGSSTKASVSGDNAGNEVCSSLAFDQTESILYCGGHSNGNFIESTGGGYDVFVVAVTTASGSLLWSTQLGFNTYPIKSASDDFCRSIAVDVSGKIYCGGMTNGEMGGNLGGGGDAMIVQLSDTGAVNFTTQAGSANYPSATSEDSCSVLKTSPLFSGVYCAGYTYSDLNGNTAGKDAFVMKVDSSGTIDWLEQMGSNYQTPMSSQFAGDEGCSGLAISQTGHVICAGETNGYVKDNNAQTDIFLATFNDGLVTPIKQIGSSYTVSDWISGARDSEECRALAKDGAGNLYCAGYTMGSLAETTGGNSDAVVMKFNSSGVLQWVRQLGLETSLLLSGDASSKEMLTSIAVDDVGNIYAGGWTQGDLTDGNGSGLGNTGMDPIILKLSPDGAVLWLKHLGLNTAFSGGDNSGNDSCNAIVVNNDSGHVYCAGQTNAMGETNAGANDAFVMRLDLNGNLVNITQFGMATSAFSNSNTTDDIINAIGIDSDSNVYVAGSTNNERDAFVMALNSNLDLTWIRETVSGDMSYETCLSLTTDKQLNTVYCGGRTFGNLGDINGGNADAFVMALDMGTGSLNWTTQLGSVTNLAGDSSQYEECSAIAKDVSGDIFCAGYTTGNLRETLVGETDGFIIKLNSLGQLSWIKHFGVTTHQASHDNLYTQYIYGLTTDESGNIYGAGMTTGSSGETNGASVNNLTPDAYIFKLKPDGSF